MIYIFSYNSTNTDIDVKDNSKYGITRLSSIAETNVETIGDTEPEYEDLYEMINQVVRSGMGDDSTSLETNSDKINGSEGSDSYLVDYNCNQLSNETQINPNNCKQFIEESEPTPSQYFYDDIFYDQLTTKGSTFDESDKILNASDVCCHSVLGKMCCNEKMNESIESMALSSQFNLRLNPRNNFGLFSQNFNTFTEFN